MHLTQVSRVSTGYPMKINRQDSTHFGFQFSKNLGVRTPKKVVSRSRISLPTALALSAAVFAVAPACNKKPVVYQHSSGFEANSKDMCERMVRNVGGSCKRVY
ncbi:MAG: hypothetical protein KTR14_06040 [Vampirovibrio sp.]|nr:hypothetical protein [Vampirovibrio sp.]